MLTRDQLLVKTLGPCRIPSPLQGSKRVVFVNENNRVRYHDKIGSDVPVDEADLSFEEAGPQPMVFFEPARTTAAIVTCGGLSPGLNNVIRAVYSELKHNYGVSRILGIRDGYQGLNPAVGQAPIELTREFVEDIDKLGGTVLGTSRGPQQSPVVVDFLKNQGIDILFCIGGDGTQRGAHAISEEINRRGLPISVIGIPKTIDNDIPFVWMTFGYQTSLQEAERILRGAHVEAKGALNGIAVVKLMGRHAGFIAAGASIASDEANFVLVPEVPFPLHGDEGLLEMLRHRMQRRGHALIVVAEGAGQHLAADPEANVQRDASGNVRFEDIGVFLCHRIKNYFTGIGVPVSVKYIDPSYVIRSVPANTWDRILANQMGRFAAHAGMAGRTDTLIGLLHNELIHVPLTTVTSHKRQLDLQSDLWMAVLSATGQPRWCG